jgi:hypothetical protein
MVEPIEMKPVKLIGGRATLAPGKGDRRAYTHNSGAQPRNEE